MTGAAAVFAALAAFGQAAGPAVQKPPVDIRTSLTRTAVWLGERVIYTVELACAPGVDVLLDDLAGARLRIDGGDLVSAEEDHGALDDRTIRRFRYTLVTYRVDAAELRVAPIPVRYFVRRAEGVDGSPAGQLSVPQAVIAIRSAIPDRAGIPPARIPADLRPPPRYLAIAQPLGLALIALAMVPVAFLSVDLAGWGRRAWERHRVHRNRRRRRVSLESLRSTSPGSDAERVEAFDRLDALVREHLALKTAINAAALTPSEIGRALAERDPAMPHGQIEALLAACERARYAADPPAAAAWSDALRDAEEILGADRR